MAQLLVSVRSPLEAQHALDGGADVIDIKEPARGPLGRAAVATWRAIRAVVPPPIPLSVALGELSENDGMIRSEHLEPITFCKIGLANVDIHWRDNLKRLSNEYLSGPSWVAVIYADWVEAGSPEPGSIVDFALAWQACAGILVDTWDKRRTSPVDTSPAWRSIVRTARDAGKFVALAGGLTAEDIPRLSPLEPDLFAFRGAACSGSHREGVIDPARVARLAHACHEISDVKTPRH